MTRGEKLLAFFLLGAGISHFANPDFFDAIVPPALPGSERLATYLSGVAEIAVGVAVIVQRTRRMALWAAAALFIAVYPANLYMAWDWRDRELSERLVAYGRLPLQIPLIWWTVAMARRQRAAL
ncbi:membrane protein [Actinomycetes bacterium]|nr:membrane protein [Actinomycetes bacterium]